MSIAQPSSSSFPSSPLFSQQPPQSDSNSSISSSASASSSSSSTLNSQFMSSTTPESESRQRRINSTSDNERIIHSRQNSSNNNALHIQTQQPNPISIDSSVSTPKSPLTSQQKPSSSPWNPFFRMRRQSSSKPYKASSLQKVMTPDASPRNETFNDDSINNLSPQTSVMSTDEPSTNNETIDTPSNDQSSKKSDSSSDPSSNNDSTQYESQDTIHELRHRSSSFSSQFNSHSQVNFSTNQFSNGPNSINNTTTSLQNASISASSGLPFTRSKALDSPLQSGNTSPVILQAISPSISFADSHMMLERHNTSDFVQYGSSNSGFVGDDLDGVDSDNGVYDSDDLMSLSSRRQSLSTTISNTPHNTISSSSSNNNNNNNDGDQQSKAIFTLMRPSSPSLGPFKSFLSSINKFGTPSSSSQNKNMSTDESPRIRTRRLSSNSRISSNNNSSTVVQVPPSPSSSNNGHVNKVAVRHFVPNAFSLKPKVKSFLRITKDLQEEMSPLDYELKHEAKITMALKDDSFEEPAYFSGPFAAVTSSNYSPGLQPPPIPSEPSSSSSSLVSTPKHTRSPMPGFHKNSITPSPFVTPGIKDQSRQLSNSTSLLSTPPSKHHLDNSSSSIEHSQKFSLDGTHFFHKPTSSSKNNSIYKSSSLSQYSPMNQSDSDLTDTEWSVPNSPAFHGSPSKQGPVSSFDQQKRFKTSIPFTIPIKKRSSFQASKNFTNNSASNSSLDEENSKIYDTSLESSSSKPTSHGKNHAKSSRDFFDNELHDKEKRHYHNDKSSKKNNNSFVFDSSNEDHSMESRKSTAHSSTSSMDGTDFDEDESDAIICSDLCHHNRDIERKDHHGRHHHHHHKEENYNEQDRDSNNSITKPPKVASFAATISQSQLRQLRKAAAAASTPTSLLNSKKPSKIITPFQKYNLVILNKANNYPKYSNNPAKRKFSDEDDNEVSNSLNSDGYQDQHEFLEENKAQDHAQYEASSSCKQEKGVYENNAFKSKDNSQNQQSLDYTKEKPVSP